jgi:hypothetical protein
MFNWHMSVEVVYCRRSRFISGFAKWTQANF